MREGRQVDVAHPERYGDPPPLCHVRDPSARVRNPALGDLEVTIDKVNASVDVRNYEADGGGHGRRDLWGFLHALVKLARYMGRRANIT